MNEPNLLTVTREELYEQVWTTPIRVLAKEYKMSDVGLAKAIDGLGIPRPGVGHWARVAAGKKIKRRPLPPKQGGQRESLTFNLSAEPPTKDAIPSEVKDWISEIAASLEISVPETLIKPYPLVKEAKQSLKGRRVESGRLVPSYAEPTLDLRVSKESLDRALRIMNSLLQAFDSFEVSVDNLGRSGGMRATRDGVSVKFWLHEKSKRRELPKSSYSWRKFESVPSGIILVRIDPYAGHGIRREWSDGPSKKLESMIVDIAAGVTRAIESQRVRLLKQEEARMREAYQREVNWRLKEEQERFRLERERRLKLLDEQSERWQRADRIRSFVLAAEQHFGNSVDGIAPELRNWLNWASAVADETDPLTSIRRPIVLPVPGQTQSY